MTKQSDLVALDAVLATVRTLGGVAGTYESFKKSFLKDRTIREAMVTVPGPRGALRYYVPSAVGAEFAAQWASAHPRKKPSNKEVNPAQMHLPGVPASLDTLTTRVERLEAMVHALDKNVAKLVDLWTPRPSAPPAASSKEAA